ncbi:hypothetical protein HET69_41120 [Streptomyces sp. CJ_13]|nr:hypothetical protein [Streptomyces sp. CJ_13]
MAVSTPTAPAPQPYRADPAVLRALAGRQHDRSGTEDFKGAILALIKQAHQRGQELTSLYLGQALQSLFGLASYDRFRREQGKGKLRPAVEALGFRTTSTRQGFNVDLP